MRSVGPHVHKLTARRSHDQGTQRAGVTRGAHRGADPRVKAVAQLHASRRLCCCHRDELSLPSSESWPPSHATGGTPSSPVRWTCCPTRLVQRAQPSNEEVQPSHRQLDVSTGPPRWLAALARGCWCGLQAALHMACCWRAARGNAIFTRTPGVQSNLDCPTWTVQPSNLDCPTVQLGRHALRESYALRGVTV